MAGDGHVRQRHIQLTSGEGGPALLWLAALQKASDTAGFKPTLRVMGNRYRLDFAGGDAVALATVMPAVGLNPKAEEAVDMFREETERGNVKIDIKPPDVQPTSRPHGKETKKDKKGAVAIITVKAGPWKEEYRVYLGEDAIRLQFSSADVDRVYQKAHVLRLLGVKTEPRKESGRDA